MRNGGRNREPNHYDFTEIKEKFREKGWTLKQWGVRCGLHYTTLAKALQRNTASQVTAKLMAQSLGVDFESLPVTNGNGKNGKKAS